MDAPRKRLSVRTRRLLAVASVVALAGLVLSITALGVTPTNDSDDPRNKDGGEKYGGNPASDCWAHHRGEGMRDSHIVVPIVPVQVLPNTDDTYDIQVINAWKYDISALEIRVTMKGNESFLVPKDAQAAEGQADLYKSWDETLGNYQLLKAGAPGARASKAVHPFTIAPQATSLYAELNLFYKQPATAPPGVLENHLTSFLYPPGAVSLKYQFTPRESTTALKRTLVMDPKNLESGEWRFELNFTDGSATEVDYFLNVTVTYAGAGGQSFLVFSSPRIENPKDPGHPLAFIRPGAVFTHKLAVRHLSEKGDQTMEVQVRALLHYKHQDGKTPDEDHFNRFATVRVKLGDQRVESATLGAAATKLGVDVRLVAGEVSGFAAAFLLLPSLLFGGTYGKGSRKLFNQLLGGAKRRVMYHNLLSLGLTLVAAVHIVLFMLEIRYTVLMGVLWGGFGALSLLILGLTGYYQVPLIQRYGYNWWRYTHLVFGILVVLFASWHAIADGPDFNFLRQQLPSWLDDLNLAYK